MNELKDAISKAEKFLVTAELVLKHGDYDTCVSRCYYAMYIMTESVLLTKEIQASSHKGVISLFGQHFIKAGIFEEDMGKAINNAYDKRLYGDYSIGFTITEIIAKEQLKIAKKFVKTIKNYLLK
ncbi:MAG: HEPN domain-containing protein [Candidatus Heimdallarchaeota archaeon]